jgi:hypothetical protein
MMTELQVSFERDQCRDGWVAVFVREKIAAQPDMPEGILDVDAVRHGLEALWVSFSL